MPSAPKSKRIQDPGFRNKIIGRDGVCLYGLHERAECSGGLDPHHIKTRGSGGDDTYDNGITLCRKHHSQAHSGHISADYLRLILNNYYKYEYPEVM
jgi:predicted restriction endonuclease